MVIDKQVTNLVKAKQTQTFKNQLESLILAQSER